MNDVINEINKLDDQKSKIPGVFINVQFSDEYITYKEFYFVAQRKVLFKINDSYREILNQDSNYKQTIYDETINRAYRPKVRIEDFCTSIIKYICCKFNVIEVLDKCPNEQSEISLKIHLDKEESSIVSFLTENEQARLVEFHELLCGFDYEYNFIRQSELSMSIISKVEFLFPDERRFLLEIIKKVKEFNQTSCRLTMRDIAQLLFKYKEIDEYDCYHILRCLENLSFYEFILYQPEYTFKDDGSIDEWYQNITVCDLEIIDEYFKYLEGLLLLPADPGSIHAATAIGI